MTEGRKTALINKSLGISRPDRNGDLEIKICFQVWHWGGMKYTECRIVLHCTNSLKVVLCRWHLTLSESKQQQKKLSPLKLFLTREQPQQVLGRLLAEEVPACRQPGQRRSLGATASPAMLNPIARSPMKLQGTRLCRDAHHTVVVTSLPATASDPPGQQRCSGEKLGQCHAEQHCSSLLATSADPS